MKACRVNLFIVLLFIAILYLPILSFPFVKKTLKQDTSENRELASFPNIDLADIHSIKRFPTSFDNYWNDNLPYRNLLKQSWENINIKLFKNSTNSRVLIGKNDGDFHHSWLFYNDVNDGDPLGYVRGTNTIEESTKIKYYEILKKNTEYMEQKRKEIFYFIAPNKSTIYSEYLPNFVNIVGNLSRTDDLYQYMQVKNVTNFFYAKDILMKNKGEYPLYYGLDTHWNSLGAFYATRALIQLQNSKFDLYDHYEIVDEGYRNSRGDLYTFMNTNVVFSDREIHVKTEADEQYDIISNDIINNDELFRTYNENAIIDKKVMLIGDSYRGAMKPYMANVYKECLFLHRNSYSKELYESYNPDLIILEAVERYQDQLFSFQFYE